jgi:sec-independent protein translocase protein TatC
MRNTLRKIWRIVTAPFRFIFWIFKSLYRWIHNTVVGVRELFSYEPEERPITDTISDALDEPKEFWLSTMDHLNELRKHIFRAVLFLVLTTAISFIFIRQLLDWLAQPVGGIEELQAIDVTEPLGVVMRVALLAGFSLALPYIIFELWYFAAPGLKQRARILGLIAIPIATLFFIGGMAFAYYVMMPTALPFLLNFMGIQTMPRPSSYIRFVTGVMFWIGLAFEFPLVIYVIAGMGLVRAKVLAAQWRLAVVIIAVMAAAITPTIDPVNMALVMGPMIVLYFLGIGLAYIAEGRREEPE